MPTTISFLSIAKYFSQLSATVVDVFFAVSIVKGPAYLSKPCDYLMPTSFKPEEPGHIFQYNNFSYFWKSCKYHIAMHESTYILNN